MANEIPLDLVLNMKRQGLSNDQIVQNLQREGFPQENIFNAINQADIKGNVESIPPNMMGSPEPQNPMMMDPQSMNMPQDMNQQMMVDSQITDTNISTEELIEAIIDEKWNELLKDINKVIDWKDKAETRLVQMEQKLHDIKDEFDKLHQAIIGKVGEYDKHILDVGTEVKAMEKVFQKVLPTFVDNINELGRITDNIKRKVDSNKNPVEKSNSESSHKKQIFDD
ncbi:hypothetical protein C0585_05460 [Candidatus Woesearchaeota archaeon]|nr:MAG: hypothetical protein C0585_05460 [Candidatus Woesearchaeota archaeon]